VNLEGFFSSSVARKQKKKEEEAPAKLLDDLFRKTKSTPCIYWLPLTAEQVWKRCSRANSLLDL
jgi:hypothetical protein